MWDVRKKIGDTSPLFSIKVAITKQMKQDKIKHIIFNKIKKNDFLLVDLTVDNAFNIKVYVDKLKGNVTVNDCIQLSKQIKNQIEEITDDFSLDISSPGIDQPFKIPEQYLKNEGKKVKIMMLDGSIKKGILK
jgi:ribosome maturation factor RimP